MKNDAFSVIYSDFFKQHIVSSDHPEKPERLDKIMEGINTLRQQGTKLNIVDPKPVNEAFLRMIHSQKLINKVRGISEAGGGIISYNMMLNRHTHDVALLAVGAAKEAVDLIESNKAKLTFAALRPPGHHASKNEMGGFCFYNNIALAAEYLSKQNKRRIAIIDVDTHYGNGTSDLFYNRSDIFYSSIHIHPKYSYPGTGYPFEIGREQGEGYTVNFPLFPKTQGIDWLYSLTLISEILQQYKPQILLISLGFDALKTDSIGSFLLTFTDFQAAGYILYELANTVCKGKIACVLEGGYDLNALSTVTYSFFKGLLGNYEKTLDSVKISNVSSNTKKIMNQCRKALNRYWVF